MIICLRHAVLATILVPHAEDLPLTTVKPANQAGFFLQDHAYVQSADMILELLFVRSVMLPA